MAIKIICTHREKGYENPYEGLSLVGWSEDTTGRTAVSTVDEMVRFIEQYGNQSVYVEKNNKRSYITVMTSVFSGRKSLHSYSGAEQTDDLLTLPDCQAEK